MNFMDNTLKEFTLTVKTGERASETFILNSQFQSIASGTGEEASFRLPEGLYSIKVKVGGHEVDERHA